MNDHKKEENNKNLDESIQQIKIVGSLHFIGNIISGGILGTVLVICYLLINNNITQKTRQTIYEIINFNLSYFIYMIVSFILIFILIGIPMLIIGFILWFIILIIGFVKHLSGESYQYPLSISFLK